MKQVVCRENTLWILTDITEERRAEVAAIAKVADDVYHIWGLSIAGEDFNLTDIIEDAEYGEFDDYATSTHASFKGAMSVLDDFFEDVGPEELFTAISARDCLMDM